MPQQQPNKDTQKKSPSAPISPETNRGNRGNVDQERPQKDAGETRRTEDPALKPRHEHSEEIEEIRNPRIPPETQVNTPHKLRPDIGL